MSLPFPTPGTRWRHSNGNVYLVVLITNEKVFPENSEKYPPTVVYKGENGRFWSRRMDDWHRSMTLIEDVPSGELQKLRELVNDACRCIDLHASRDGGIGYDGDVSERFFQAGIFKRLLDLRTDTRSGERED